MNTIFPERLRILLDGTKPPAPERPMDTCVSCGETFPTIRMLVQDDGDLYCVACNEELIDQRIEDYIWKWECP
jgi:hypothetical protein